MAEESHLDIRVVDSIDYTCRDKIIFAIMDIIKCPILLESSNTMVMMNDQLYDRDAFEHHRQNESTQNSRRCSSWYNNDRLKCPQTGSNFFI